MLSGKTELRFDMGVLWTTCPIKFNVNKRGEKTHSNQPFRRNWLFHSPLKWPYPWPHKELNSLDIAKRVSQWGYRVISFPVEWIRSSFSRNRASRRLLTRKATIAWGFHHNAKIFHSNRDENIPFTNLKKFLLNRLRLCVGECYGIVKPTERTLQSYNSNYFIKWWVCS